MVESTPSIYKNLTLNICLKKEIIKEYSVSFAYLHTQSILNLRKKMELDEFIDRNVYFCEFRTKQQIVASKEKQFMLKDCI